MALVPTIGLEVHVQLNTRTKIFCGCSTSFGDSPNTHTCPVCLGLPGALPVFNKGVLQKAIMAGLAVEADIHTEHKFDRKNYFYPDLPKAYQISQFDMPFCTGGKIDIGSRTIGITRIHIEEDAGKLIHSDNKAVHESYVDLNRAGTPLIEVVSEPEIKSSEEAVLYLTQLKSAMLYIEVSDCNMEQGSLRCDANVSLAPEGSKELGTRAEIKNLNSFKGVKAAIDYEISRQTDLLQAGEKIVQETRLWDADLGQTFSMRGKEEAHDYRYFPDPDLLLFQMSREDIESLQKQLPELAPEKRDRFMKEYDLPELDAGVLTASRLTADYFEAATTSSAPPKKVSNWIMGEMMAVTGENDSELADLFPPGHLTELVSEIESGSISGKIGKGVLQEMIKSQKSPKEIIKSQGLVQISDEGALAQVIAEVVAENPDSVTDFKSGKQKALGFLVGQVMKKTQGKANPPMVNKLLSEQLK